MTCNLRRRELFGLRFVDAPDVASVMEVLLDGTCGDPAIEDPAPLVFTPNVDLLVHLARNDSPRASELVRRSAYVLADGQPVVWASRLLGEPLSTRLSGSTLVTHLWPRVVAEGRRVLVIAASEELAALVKADHPRAAVVVPPYFDANDSHALRTITKECIGACEGTRPEFVFTGLSYPKQYTLIDELMTSWPADSAPRLHLAVGAAFEMHYGLRPRAPAWMQRVGLEWLHRFAQEPRRLFRRYFIDDLAFIRIVWDERATRRAARHDRPEPTRREAGG